MKIPNMYIAFENRSINVLGMLLFLTAIIIYASFFFQFSLNIPLGYDDCLIFLKSFEEDYFDKSDFFDRVFFLLRKQHSHFSFMTRFLSVVSFHLFHEINFRFILIVSNLAHIILCLLLLRTLDFNLRKPLFYLPVILLLFAPIGRYANWPIAASAYIFSALFSFGAFYFLVRERFVVAALFALFSTLSLENGIFVFVLGFAFLIKLRCEKNLSIMIFLGWSFMMFICAYLVFMDGMKVSGSTNPLQMILEQPEILLYPFVFATSLVSRYFIPAIGAGPAVMIGMLPVIILFILFISSWKDVQKKPELVLFLLFILISGAATGFFRIAKGGIAQALAPRYEIFSLSFVTGVLLLLYHVKAHMIKRFFIPLLVLSIFFYIFRVQKIYTNAKITNYHIRNSTAYILSGKIEEYAKKYESRRKYDVALKRAKSRHDILHSAITKGFYSPPQDVYELNK